MNEFCTVNDDVLLPKYIRKPIEVEVDNNVKHLKINGDFHNVWRPLMDPISLYKLQQNFMLTVTIEKGGTRLFDRLLLIVATNLLTSILVGLERCTMKNFQGVFTKAMEGSFFL